MRHGNRLARFALVAVAAAVGAVTLAGCGYGGSDGKAEDAAPVRSYVGTAQGTGALVAAVVDGSRVLAYVCDGMPSDAGGTAPSVQAWFNGTSDGKVVDVQQAAGRLELRLTGSAMTGTVTLADGRKLPVAGGPVTGDAGLYRAEVAGAPGMRVAGWILGPDGQQRGGFGDGVTLSGVRTLTLSQPTFTLQGLATARIAKVGITPIPIP